MMVIFGIAPAYRTRAAKDAENELLECTPKLRHV